MKIHRSADRCVFNKSHVSRHDVKPPQFTSPDPSRAGALGGSGCGRILMPCPDIPEWGPWAHAPMPGPGIPALCATAPPAVAGGTWGIPVWGPWAHALIPFAFAPPAPLPRLRADERETLYLAQLRRRCAQSTSKQPHGGGTPSTSEEQPDGGRAGKAPESQASEASALERGTAAEEMLLAQLRERDGIIERLQVQIKNMEAERLAQIQEKDEIIAEQRKQLDAPQQDEFDGKSMAIVADSSSPLLKCADGKIRCSLHPVYACAETFLH